VSRVRRSVDYRQLKLSWLPPGDADFDHVEVLRTHSLKGAASAVVYQGQRRSYVDKRFRNGLDYRFEIRAYNVSGQSSQPVHVEIKPSALLTAPRDGAVVTAPPLMRWMPIRGATFYNVQLYFGTKKVLSAWPSAAKQKLSRRWSYKGRQFRLRKGEYRWYVWPGFGPRAKPHYGQLLGTSSFGVR
jgi:hypothetical protein